MRLLLWALGTAVVVTAAWLYIRLWQPWKPRRVTVKGKGPLAPPSPNVFDVVIVGAGPSGSVAAWFLAKAGKRVLLLERKQFPRPKMVRRAPTRPCLLLPACAVRVGCVAPAVCDPRHET
jgi:hypothetical protein